MQKALLALRQSNKEAEEKIANYFKAHSIILKLMNFSWINEATTNIVARHMFGIDESHDIGSILNSNTDLHDKFIERACSKIVKQFDAQMLHYMMRKPVQWVARKSHEIDQGLLVAAQSLLSSQEIPEGSFVLTRRSFHGLMSNAGLEVVEYKKDAHIHGVKTLIVADDMMGSDVLLVGSPEYVGIAQANMPVVSISIQDDAVTWKAFLFGGIEITNSKAIVLSKYREE